MQNRKKKVILHIGTHKTGTTSFQKLLKNQELNLTSRGMHLFKSIVSQAEFQSWEFGLLTVRNSLNYPARRMFFDSTLPSMQEIMRSNVSMQMLSDAQQVIVSNEALSFIRTSEEVENLATLIKGRDVRIILSLRNPSSFLISWKHQLEKMEMPTTSKFRDSVCYTNSDTWLIQWDQLVKVFVEIFGEESMNIINYDEEVNKDGTILKKLWSTAFPEIEFPNEDIWLNTSEI